MRRHVRSFVRQFRIRLRDPRFWIVQALVIVITVGHGLLEAGHHLASVPALDLLPVSTYFIPVIYAALNFGVEGAVPTALWSAVLTVPNLILWHTWPEQPGEAMQLTLLVVLAYVIARRVDVEKAAKERAEAAQATLEEYVRLATNAQEEERKRLARELHDDTIQALLTAKGQIDTLAAKPPEPENVRARLRTVDATLAAAIDDVRRFSRDLRPSLLDDLGLVDAIEWLVDDLAARIHVEAQLRTIGEPRRLRPEDEIALFRIVQEALHNVERHAAANAVKVRIHFGDTVRAVVIDDGRGFEPSELLGERRAAARLGVLGMRERAKIAGAALSIRSRPSCGTRVAVTLGPAG